MKLEDIIGEEFYDMGPAVLTAIIVAAGIVALIFKSLPFSL